MKNLNYIDRSNEYYKSKYGKGFDVRLPFLDNRKKKKYKVSRVHTDNEKFFHSHYLTKQQIIVKKNYHTCVL